MARTRGNYRGGSCPARPLAAKCCALQLSRDRDLTAHLAIFKQGSLVAFSAVALVGPRGAQLESKVLAFQHVLQQIPRRALLGVRFLDSESAAIFFVPPLAPGRPERILEAITDAFAPAD